MQELFSMVGDVEVELQLGMSNQAICTEVLCGTTEVWTKCNISCC